MILCMMRIPPHPEGHGGNQRAWHLVNALAQHDRVHLALVYPASDTAAAAVPLDRVRTVVDGVTVFPCLDWGASSERWPGLPWALGTWVDRVRIGSVDAPRLSGKTLKQLARALPLRSYATLFAARTSVAVIAETMLRRGEIHADQRILDIDDVMSQFRRRQRDAQPNPSGIMATVLRANWNVALDSEIALLQRVEARLATNWDALAVCSDDDIVLMRQHAPNVRVETVPNVVDHPLLPPRNGTGLHLLFVGNLQFAPNTHGLARFLSEAWPQIINTRPDAVLDVVGMSPPDDLAGLLALPGVSTHRNVPDIEPYYANADVVIAPIFFGGGTRIKILEAMAFGRPVVATPLAAEGLGLVGAHDVMIADSMQAFASAVLELGADPAFRAALATSARVRQQRFFSPAVLNQSVAALLRLGKMEPIRPNHRKSIAD